MGKTGAGCGRPMKMPNRYGWAFTLLWAAFVFFPGGHTAANMPLLFIDIQHLPHLTVKQPVTLGQTLLEIFMYGGFGDTEVLCCGAYRSSGFNHVHSKLTDAIFDGI